MYLFQVIIPAARSDFRTVFQSVQSVPTGLLIPERMDISITGVHPFDLLTFKLQCLL